MNPSNLTLCQDKYATTREYLDLSDSESSDIFPEEKLLIKLGTKKKTINKKIEIANIKHLPTIFFFLFLLVLGLVMVNFIPRTYAIAANSSLYKEKSKIKYIPEYFSEQTSGVKTLIISSQILLLAIIICLTSLIKQRISVPEFKDESWRNYLTVLASIISSICLLAMTFYNQETLELSKKIGLVDNMCFFIYIFSSFLYCLMTFCLTGKLDAKEQLKEGYFFPVKKYLLILMGVQIFSYFIADILVSFYNPIISQEKTLLSILIICFSLNSVIFLLCLLLFILSLKYDLNFVYMNLQMRPDIEYFIDSSENNCK